MRYLIVGFGNIGKKRANILGKKFAASCDPDPKTDADYQKIEDIPDNIYDAAVLTIPQQFKLSLTNYFLNRGKHVLNEKPFIVSQDEITKLNKISNQKKVYFYTSYNHRYEPNIQKLTKKVLSGKLGKFYFGRMIYSFGNIKQRLGTWRETEFGVLEEIAPHLIDLCFGLFGYKGNQFECLFSRKIESKIFDHWVFTTSNQKLVIETGSLSWKNNFSLELYFEKGSLHLSGLRKWGESQLIERKRILPSGVPLEKIYLDKGPDQSWVDDFAYFEKKIREGKSSSESDLQMSLALASIALSSKNPEKDEQYKLYKKILK